jgi:hypothetical protein
MYSWLFDEEFRKKHNLPDPPPPRPRTIWIPGDAEDQEKEE